MPTSEMPHDSLGLLALVLLGVGVAGRLAFGVVTQFLTKIADSIGRAGDQLAGTLREVGVTLAEIRKDAAVNHSDVQRCIERSNAELINDLRAIALENRQAILHELRNVRADFRARIPHHTDEAADAAELAPTTGGIKT